MEILGIGLNWAFLHQFLQLIVCQLFFIHAAIGLDHKVLEMILYHIKNTSIDPNKEGPILKPNSLKWGTC